MTHGWDKRRLYGGYMALRWKILERDKFTCQYCGQHAPNVKLEVDHVIPVTDGGTDDPDNLKTSCYACNRGKSGLAIQIKSDRQNPFKAASPEDFKEPSLRDKIREVLLQESLTYKAIAEKIAANPNSVQVVLSRNKGRFAKTKFKLWTLKETL